MMHSNVMNFKETLNLFFLHFIGTFADMFPSTLPTPKNIIISIYGRYTTVLLVD